MKVPIWQYQFWLLGNWLTDWVLGEESFEKLFVTEVIEKFPPFAEPPGSLFCWQENTMEPYPELF